MSAIPPDRPEAVIAVLTRGSSVVLPSSEHVELLRLALTTRSGRQCSLSIVEHSADKIMGIGGVGAVIECAKAVNDTASWWQ
jgi:hypothetical protein